MKDEGLSTLHHERVPTGGDVYVLDTGAVIDAEAEAMLQALHSRSTGGLEAHLRVLQEKGPENFMKNFYVGYGHKTIGDCGSTTIFIEGVSMLVAKAIQDFPLYSGQEASTRYVDFSRQRFVDPTDTWKGEELLERQRAFYLLAQEPTRAHLKNQYPRKEGEKEEVYEKAIAARAFDITRSLLPAGSSTNLAWHTNLRQAADRILFLRHHPLREVRGVAKAIEVALRRVYPNSFSHKRYSATEGYQDLVAGNYFYHDAQCSHDPVVDLSRLCIDRLKQYKTLLERRPPKVEIPRLVAQAGEVDISFQLDFGSFRDIHRHRPVVQRMPLLTQDLGFHPWYLDNFPPEVSSRIGQHLEDVRELIQELAVSSSEAQYFIPMGYKVSNHLTGNLPEVVYLVELRAKSDVHPTLQHVAYGIGNQLKDTLSIPIHMGAEPGRFDIRRGEQDIVERKK